MRKVCSWIFVSMLVVVCAGCGRAGDEVPPVASPSAKFNTTRPPLGSPIEVSYRWVVEPHARFDQDYRVMVHFLDSDEELMWTDDHLPPKPTTQWKAGETVEYTRTMFVPIYPYIGKATVVVGLYSVTTQTRLPLIGEDRGQRSYKVADIQLLPQTENVFVIYKDGWHPAEVAEDNPAVDWQWTKKDSVLAFRNPKRDCLLYLSLDGQPSGLPDPQTLTISIGGQTLDSFGVGRDQILRKTPITTAQLGTADMVELRLQVDKTIVPAALPGAKSRDPRDLGVRVFHAFVEPK
ncbi:MAG: hypothetical protein HYZ58_15960 [Acidobacteria bacterium]|nr:hypothetical protein [Acidobacteriota bacterium]